MSKTAKHNLQQDKNIVLIMNTLTFRSFSQSIAKITEEDRFCLLKLQFYFRKNPTCFVLRKKLDLVMGIIGCTPTNTNEELVH